MLLSQFAAEHEIPITDRKRLIDALERFVREKNYAFYKEASFGDSFTKKRVIRGVIALVVSMAAFFTGMLTTVFGETGGMILMLLIAGYGGVQLTVALDRMRDGVGPYHIEVYVVGSKDMMPKTFDKLSADLQAKTNAFFDAFPGGTVYFGTLHKDDDFVQPTSLRFEHGEETVNVWASPDIYTNK